MTELEHTLAEQQTKMYSAQSALSILVNRIGMANPVGGYTGQPQSDLANAITNYITVAARVEMMRILTTSQFYELMMASAAHAKEPV